MDDLDYLRNWEILKPLLLAKWTKLREHDLDRVQPLLGEVVKVIQSKYMDFPKESIISDIENLDEQILKNP